MENGRKKLSTSAPCHRDNRNFSTFLTRSLSGFSSANQRKRLDSIAAHKFKTKMNQAREQSEGFASTGLPHGKNKEWLFYIYMP